jgi:hypothetical protein
MTDLETTAAALADARKRHMQAQEEHFETHIAPKLQRMVGQHWVYRRNCYSCPEKPSDYWDVYGRVDGVDGASLILTVAYVDSYGKPTLHRESAVSFDGEMPTKWEKTTAKAFNTEVRRVLALLGVGVGSAVRR